MLLLVCSTVAYLDSAVLDRDSAVLDSDTVVEPFFGHETAVINYLYGIGIS